MRLAYFRVDIDKLEQEALPDETGLGFVDDTKSQDYPDGPSSTWELSLQKARGNMRYTEILRKINFVTLIDAVLDVVKPDADPDTAPTTWSATFVFDREEYLRTEDEANPGEYLEGADAIKRFIARALTTEFTSNSVVYDPTAVDGTPSYAAYGYRVLDVTCGPAAADIAAAEAAITVIRVQYT